MAWRVVELGDLHWNVSLAAERRAHSTDWVLVFGFRSTGTGRRSLWATYPLQSESKAFLFAQAERIPNEALTALLAERLG